MPRCARGAKGACHPGGTNAKYLIILSKLVSLKTLFDFRYVIDDSKKNRQDRKIFNILSQTKTQEKNWKRFK